MKSCTKKKAQATTLTDTEALVRPNPRISERPRLKHERSYLLSRDYLKITSFQYQDLKQKHFKYFYIYNHKYNEVISIEPRLGRN